MTTMKSRLLHLIVLLPLCCASALCAAQSNRADRNLPVNIEADRMTIDDRNKTNVFEGAVVMTQGTLQIRGDRVVVSQGADGFQRGVATGGGGRLATFRQKREGTNTYIEGEAERIEYDSRAERARLFGRARVSSGGDVVSGDFIEYDALTEKYTASRAQSSRGRVRAVIQPRGDNQNR